MSKPKPSSKPIYTQYTRKSTSEKNANEGVYKAGIKKKYAILMKKNVKDDNIHELSVLLYFWSLL